MKNYKVLSVRQPWAELIIAGIKPVENRNWRVEYRGTILIHASQHRNVGLVREHGLDPDHLDFGAIIGSVELIDIVGDHPSKYFVGPLAWVLANPRRVLPVPMAGKLSLYNATLKLKHV
jgi:hypothetical protein